MKILAITIAIGALFVILACGAATPQPPEGVLLPYPEEGKQYRMSEVCSHLESQGYSVKGTVHHTVDADDLSGLLERIPSLARRPVENYIGDGIGIELEVLGLCKALNR